MKTKPFTSDFGQRLVQLRRAKGLTQTELGEKIGVSKRVVAYYEGQTKYPPAHLMIPIAKALKISLDELFGAKKGDLMEEPDQAALWRKLKQAKELSPKDRKTLVDFLDALLVRGKTINK